MKAHEKRLISQERWLTASYNAQSLNEHKVLLKRCLSVLDDMPSGSTKWCLALFTALSLITGRPQKRLALLPFSEKGDGDEWWELDGDKAILYYRPKIIRSDLENLLEDGKYRHLLNEVKTGPFPLLIPSSLGKHLATWKTLSPTSRKSVHDVAGTIIEELQEYNLRPFSPTRVISALSYFLSTQSCGVADIGYLTGLSPRRCVALHYSQLKVSEVIPVYMKFLDELGFDQSEISNVPDGIVGTALAMDGDALSNIYQSQISPLKVNPHSLYDYKHLHNDITYMIWVYLQLATGHRHNVTALKSILHADLKAGVLIVEDKTTRPHILAKSAVKQLEYYINYLQNFLREAQAGNSKIADIIEDSINGNKPLFFLLDSDGKLKSFSVVNLRKLVRSFWDFPPNWARHFSLTHLVTRLPADQFPAWAGHLEGAKEADGDYSSLTPALQTKASEVMSGVLEEFGILPFNPCETESISTPEVPLPGALKKIRAWKKNDRQRRREQRKTSGKTPDTKTSKAYWSKELLQIGVSLRGWETKFETCLKNLSDKSASLEDWVALTLYSALTRGNLTKPEMLFDLYRQLCRGDINWWTVSDCCFIDLRYQVEIGPYNLRIHEGKKDQSYRQMQWPIDIQTLCLLLAGPFSTSGDLKYLPQDEEDFYLWLSDWFVGAEGKCFSLKKLCLAAPYIQWFGLGADTSYAETYITGPDQVNFTPNKDSLISLYSAPNKIVWSKPGRAIRAPIKPKDDKKKKLRSVFGDTVAASLKSLLRSAKNTPRAIRSIQQYIRHDTVGWSEESLLLLQWLEYKFSNIKIVTAIQYLDRIATEWLTAVDNCDFSELDADEILQVYQSIYTETDEVGRRENYVSSLRWLHRFGMAEYGWPINDALADFLKTKANLTYVRTSIVDHRHVYNVLEAIDRSYEDEIFRAQLKLILLIGYRCGLRVGEILKLRFRDIDPASDWAISVRGSRLGSNKSDNSLRRIEFANVASNEELELFKQYFHQIGVDSKVSDYLFGLGGQDIPLNQVRCSQLLGGALRQSTDNNEVVFHSLRHSWASSTYAIIDQEWELAKEITGFDPEKLTSVRRYWLRSDDFMRDGLRQLSKALGHADSKTTCQTYLHLQPETIHRKISKVIWSKPSVQESIKKLRNFRQSELDTMGYDLVMNRLVKQVRKHTGEDVIPVRKDVSFKPNLTFDLPATYFIMMSALKKVEEGQGLGHVAEQYPVTEHALEGMVNRCRALTSLKTRVKTSKLVKQRTVKGDGDVRRAILPALHPSPEIRELVVDISNAIRKGYQKNSSRKIIIKQAFAVFKAFTAGGHYLRVDKHEGLTAIVSFTQNVLSEEQWFFDLVVHVQEHVENEHVEVGNAAAYWKQDPVFNAREYRPQITTGPDESENPHGVVHVTVEHSKKRLKYGGDGRRHGVKMLGWLAYMTVVLYGTSEEVEAFSEMVC